MAIASPTVDQRREVLTQLRSAPAATLKAGAELRAMRSPADERFRIVLGQWVKKAPLYSKPGVTSMTTSSGLLTPKPI